MITGIATTLAATAIGTIVETERLVIDFIIGDKILPVAAECLWYSHTVEETNVYSFMILDGPDSLFGFDTSVSADRTGMRGEQRWRIEMLPFDSVLEMKVTHTVDGPRGTAVWTKPRPGGEATLRGTIRPLREQFPFASYPAKGHPIQFDPVGRPLTAMRPDEFNGRWRVDFSSSEVDAVAVFEVDEYGAATGTFLTTTGDYRSLSGRAEDNFLRLSTFDGAHAFLFHAELQPSGEITGDFYSGNWWHERWTAVRDDDYQLPDPFGLSAVTDENFAALSFPDLDGNEHTIGEFLTGPTVIEVFGSWCPNCTDASTLLAEYARTYPGLNVLGLAVEFGPDHATNAARVRKHLGFHGAGWPVLIASESADKDEATRNLGFLDRVRAYPTLIFVDPGPDGPEVRAVYTGFNGPATGAAHAKMREDFERIIAGMLRD